MIKKGIVGTALLGCAFMLEGMNTILNQAATIESKVELIVQADVAESVTLSTLDQTVLTINSKTDYITTAWQTISAGTYTVESIIDRANSGALNVINALNTTISNYAQPQSVIASTLSLNQTIGSTLSTINSELDVSINTALTIVSKSDYIVPIVSAIDSAALYTSQLNVLWSTIDVSLQTISSQLGVATNDAQTISSLISTIDTQINNDISTLFTASSNIDVGNSVIATVASSELTVGSRLSNVVSTLAKIDTEIVSIQSSLLTAQSRAITDAYDFSVTWTALDQLNTTLATISSNANTVNSQTSNLYFAYSNPGTFTVIDAINQTTLTSESIVTALQATLNAINVSSYNGTFTMLNSILAQVQISKSFLDSIVNTFTLIQPTQQYFGTAITQSMVGTTGYTITSSGSYYLSENITFSPSVSGSQAIRINSSNVYLNLNGRTLKQGNATTNVAGIRNATNRVNMVIENGNLLNFTDGGLDLNLITNLVIRDLIINGCNANSLTGIDTFTIKRMSVINAVTVGSSPTTIVDGGKGLLEDCNFNNPSSSIGLSLGGTQQGMVRIKNCRAIAHQFAGFATRTNGTTHYFDGCIAEDNGSGPAGTAGGIVLSNTGLPSASFIVKGCLIGNSGNATPGIDIASNLSFGTVKDTILLGNTLVNNEGNGIKIGLVSNNIVIGNTIIAGQALVYCIEQDNGSNTYLGNTAFSTTTEANNYVIGSPTVIPKSIIKQSGNLATLSTKPSYWYNLSLTP